MNLGRGAIAAYFLFGVFFSFTYTIVNTYAGPIGLQNIGENYIWVFVGWDCIEAGTWYLFCVETQGRTLEIDLRGTQLGGRLEYGFPVAQPCFDQFQGSLNDPKSNSQQCGVVQAGWKTEALYGGSDFGAYPTSGVPPLYIAVKGPSDIQSAFKFVKKHKIPLV
ncbi:hypothetical protein RQP46_001713 [Phenoliferia psychrophenolica]